MAFDAYFAELGAGAVHHHDRRAGARERLVERHHHLGAARDLRRRCTTRSGFMKSSTAAPCFRNSGLLTTLNGCVVSRRDDLADLFGGADRHGALVDDDPVAVHRAGRCRAPRRARAARSAEPSSPCGVPTAMNTICERRDRLAARSVVKTRRPLRLVALDELVEARLVNRNLAPSQHARPSPSSLSTHITSLPVFGQTGAKHQSDITRPDDRNLHSRPPKSEWPAYHPQVLNAVNILNHKDLPRSVVPVRGVRILVDYRPALRERTGVGEFVHELARALNASGVRRGRQPDAFHRVVAGSARPGLEPLARRRRRRRSTDSGSGADLGMEPPRMAAGRVVCRPGGRRALAVVRC